MTADDASLVSMITGDRNRANAEAEVCARYRRRVHLYGLRHLRDASAADDLVQDVFATVIERVRRGELNDPDKLGAFILGTCRMQVIGRKRSEARRARILAIYGDPRIDDAAADETFEVTAGDLERVRDCLARLADRDRTVLLLTFYAELDADALGREVGLQPNNVRVIRHRALGRLQACVRGSEEAAE